MIIQIQNKHFNQQHVFTEYSVKPSTNLEPGDVAVNETDSSQINTSVFSELSAVCISVPVSTGNLQSDNSMFPPLICYHLK